MTTDVITHMFDGQEVRAGLDGEVAWIAAPDVARILGYAQAKDMTRTLDPDEKGRRLVPTPGGEQEITILTEPGLYRVIVQRQTGRIDDLATRERIRRFQRWVTHEVLPSIRKTGSYGTPALTGPELMAKALIEANATLQQALPKAEAYDAFLSTAGDYSVNEAAKILSRDHGIHKGERKLRDLLIEWGWIYRDSGGPRAMQAQINTGRLAEKARWHYHPQTGERVTDTPQVRVTPKGIDAIRQRLVGLKVLTA